ncbi:MAG TPA: hypothetical protein VHF47_11755 [Acidimicrobiales bacterium]|nr:hypothetical protein [Acidimicrobiales bacterium]
MATGVFVPAADGATPWDACPSQATQQVDHVVVRGPRFTQGPLALSSIAGNPRDMASLAGGNGVEIHVSDDAGCTWQRVFTAFTGGGNSMSSVVGREGSQVRAVTVVRHVALGPTGLVSMRILVRDGKAESAHDLPPELATEDCSDTRRCLVRFAPGRALAVGYVTTSGAAGILPPRVASTTDGGRTWKVHAAPGVGGTSSAVSELAVDPDDDARLLAVAGGRLFSSPDRGETWTPVPAPATLTSFARVVFTPGTKRDAVVADRASGGTALFASTDDGATFVDAGTAVPADPVRGIVLGPSPWGPSLVLAAGGRLFREGPTGAYATFLQQGSAVDELVATSAGLWLRRTGALVWLDGLADPNTVPGLVNNRGSGRPGTPAGELKARPGGGVLRVHERVTVPPGGTGATVVTADVSKQPRGLDVFFLMDTSGSMTTKMRPMALAMGRVVDALNREGISARFGLGEHGAQSFRYRRHADLGTPPEEVQRKLLALQTSSGEEYHYTSFFQIATGKGMQARIGGSIPPGQQASFDPGALHLVVHATDEIDNTDPEGPDELTALSALKDVEAHHLGIYPYDGTYSDRSRDPVTLALRRYAEGTSTFAPPGGLDCEGDGRIDIREGEPIACAVPGSGSDAPIASLIERVLLSLSRRQPVSVEAHPSPLSVTVTPLGDYREVELHERHTGLEFRVQVACPPEQEGREVDVPLFLLVGDVTVAGALLPVTCLAASVPQPPAAPVPEEPEPPLRRAPTRVVPALPPLASAPPALAQSTATASAQATSAASQGAQATQVGIAVAPDEALQAATEEEEVRFVARRSTPPTVPAGGALALAIALLLAAEPRVATALARTRDWRERRW